MENSSCHPCSLCYCEAGKLHVVRGSGVIFLSFDLINTSQRSLYMSTLTQVSIVSSHSPTLLPTHRTVALAAA